MFRFANAIGAVLTVVVLAGPALATPVTVMFNSTVMIDGEDGFGVEEQDALRVADDFGIPILTPPFVGEIDPILTVLSQDVNEGSVQPFPPTGPGEHTATSTWQMQNVSEFDLEMTYLMFVTSDPFDAAGQMIDYDDGKVGLSIDADTGWVFIKVSVAEGNLYYPALALGALDAGEISDFFNVFYVIEGPLQESGTTFVLPALRLGMAVIPEPGTAGLLGLGLLLIAVSRRRRSQ